MLFVFSGATGLVDQLCFSKYLGYVVGSTAYAVSAVLAAFMTGLALGAHYGGRASLRIRRSLMAYGVLELVVAFAVALTPLAFRFLTPLYAQAARHLPNSLATLSVLRWAVALGLVVVPTTAMGATLPLLARSLDAGASSRGVDAGETRERRLGALYAFNTLGGALGALAAAYWILPALGVDGTIVASALTSALIGCSALLAGRAQSSESEYVEAAVHSAPRSFMAPTRAETRRLFGVAFASGCLVFAAEVVFTHLLALIIGNSAYAFGLILAAFLSCLSIGAARATRAQRRFGEAALPLGLAASGVALALTLPLWDKAPYFFNNTGKVLTSFAARESVRGIAAFLVLALPTTLMGVTFPLLLLRATRYAEVGRWVGRLTAVNTIGAVVGSLATGYLLLPWLGSQRALSAVALCFVVAALSVWAWARARSRQALLVAAAVTLAVLALGPRWDLGMLTSGTNVYFEGYHAPDAILMMREDVHGGVTTVTKSGDELTLYTNGKFQGSNGFELSAQRFFAHYPSLFVSNFDDALVIGLGTGTTLGTLAGYPWKHLDVAEISPSILYAAQTFFSDINLGAIHDPRVTIHHADGRNFILVSEKRYDLISMELSSIWFAGAASLHSKEFYRLIHERLRTNGVFQQWVQMHHIQQRDLATVIATLRREFKHVALFYGGNQGILVASEAPLRASEARVLSLQASPRVARTIPAQRPLLSLLDDVLVVDAGLDAFLKESARKAGEPVEQMISTDANLYLEYATPRGNVLPWSARDELVAEIRKHRDPNAIRALQVP